MTTNGTINKTQIQHLLHYFLFDPNIYISLVITLKRKDTVKIEDIKKAIEQAYTQNETTMSKIVLDNEEVYFENMSETGCKVFVDQRDWQDILHENEKNTFKINEGEFVRTFIIDKKDEICLFIMAHHIFGDGYSLILLSQDILSNLAGESVEYKPLNNNIQEAFPSKIKYPFSKKIGIKLLNQQWKKTGRTFTWEDYFEIHKKFWTNRQSYIESTTMPENLSEIKEKCQELGIKVNSYIITKQLEKNPEYQIIGMPISVRGTNRSLSNQVAVTTFKYKYNTDISFEKNAQEIHKCLTDILDDPSKKFFIATSLSLFDPILIDGGLMAQHAGYKNDIAEKMITIMGMDGETKVQLGVTNLGKVDSKEKSDSFEVQNIVAIAAPMSSTKDVVCVCTFKDKINLCYSTVKEVK